MTTPVEGVRQVFGFIEQPNLAPRTNIAPTQAAAAVRLGEDGGRHFVWLKWGLIPSWAKEAAIGSRMINARAETVAEKPAFRSAFRRRRCLLVADGFYEWQKQPEGPKQPYRITLQDGGPFGFAGLWESWRDPAGGTVESCTIVTTEANAFLAPIHHRMPVIVSPGDFDLWLDPGAPPQTALALLRPYPDGAMAAYPVSRRVNNVANDDPEVIAPVNPDTATEGPERQNRLL